MTPEDLANSLSAAPIHDRLGIRVLRASIDEVVGTMPVEGNQQPQGLLHGGASVVLAESLASIGAAVHAGDSAQVAGIEVNATHHRAAVDGSVTGTARPLHLGRTLTSWHVEIVDSAGRPTCTARVLCIIRPL